MNPQIHARVAGAIKQWEKAGRYDAPCLGTITENHCVYRPTNNHSIQNAAVLDLLHEDGHIYAFDADATKNITRLQMVGRNRASTFTGYCARHDTEVFRDIDFTSTADFSESSPRHSALLALRASAREYWAKHSGVMRFRAICDLAERADFAALAKLFNIPEVEVRPFVNNAYEQWKYFLAGLEMGRLALRDRFESLRSQVHNNAWHHSVFRSWHLGSRPTVAAAAVCSPEHDFLGQRIAGMSTSLSDYADVAITVLPMLSGSRVLWQHHRRNRTSLNPLAAQLDAMSIGDRAIAISRFLVAYCENVVLAPSFVHTMPTRERALIETTYNTTLVDKPRLDQLPSVSLFA